VLRIDIKLWDKAFLAEGAPDSIGAQVLGKAGKYLLFLEGFLALKARMVEL
jgi:hypothetical protein